MPAMTADEARQYMAEQEPHKNERLARYVLDHFPSRETRWEFLHKIEARLIRSGVSDTKARAYINALAERAIAIWRERQEPNKSSSTLDIFASEASGSK